ncbi:MAG: NAD-dependent epimerase/dehydratase family protein [Candidatus Hydrogenedentes bacterium]|nr:NAD-dependent epimerase/dehydratase family protein [Candidatus Hydrogenedentota bacterium]
MRVLVIGGTGLISTAIVDRLLESGHDPVLFNRGQTASRLHKKVETLHGDREDFPAFEAAVKGLQLDTAIDMLTYDAPTASHAVEVFTGRIAHYLFCSTVCVYGGPLSKIPADEDEAHMPVSDYGRGKSEAEAVFMTAHKASGFPVTMFRPSHCYGPGQPLLDIFGYNPALVSRIREGRPVLVPGDGYGLWQPGYVGDMAKGFAGALGRSATLGKAYNIVGDEIMDWRNFHTVMGEVIGCGVNLAPMTTAQIMAGVPADQPEMLYEIFQYHAAYSNAALKRDVPEFTDLLPFDEGVRRTVAWMDESGAHVPADTQSWIDALVDRETAFRRSLP